MGNQDEQGGGNAAPTLKTSEIEAMLRAIFSGLVYMLASEDTPIEEVYLILAAALAGGLIAAQDLISWRWHGEQPPLAAAEHVARLILAALTSQQAQAVQS
jgi:hypothetical protein